MVYNAMCIGMRALAYCHTLNRSLNPWLENRLRFRIALASLVLPLARAFFDILKPPIRHTNSCTSLLCEQRVTDSLEHTTYYQMTFQHL